MKKNVKEADEFFHKELKNSDGTPMRYRRNGATKTWKTRPGEFSVPIKRGLKEYGYITQENVDQFTWE